MRNGDITPEQGCEQVKVCLQGLSFENRSSSGVPDGFNCNQLGQFRNALRVLNAGTLERAPLSEGDLSLF